MNAFISRTYAPSEPEMACPMAREASAPEGSSIP